MGEEKRKAIVLGAGVAGLSAGWKLTEGNYEVHVLEKGPDAGGLAYTFQEDGFLVDSGPHKLFTLLDGIIEEIESLLAPESLLKVKKFSRIRLRGKFLNYPFGLKDLLMGVSPLLGARCVASYLATSLQRSFGKVREESYEDWLIARFGKTLYHLVFAPYARKLWGDPQRLSKEVAETRVAAPSLKEVISQFLLKIKKGPVLNANFFYYPRNGVLEISKKMAEVIQAGGGHLHLQSAVQKVVVQDNRVKEVQAGDRVFHLGPEDIVISSIPVTSLVRFLDPAPPTELLTGSERLTFRHLILLYVVIRRPQMSRDQWLFFPEEKYIFNRVSEQKNFSASMVPHSGKTVICAEVTCAEESDVWQWSDEKIMEKCMEGFEEARLFNRSEVERYFTKKIPHVYPVYDLSFRDHLNATLEYFDRFKNLYSAGRQGTFTYCGICDCMDMGFKTVHHVLGKKERASWKETREKFNHYVVVD